MKESANALKDTQLAEKSTAIAVDPLSVIACYNHAKNVFVGGGKQWTSKLQTIFDKATFVDKDEIGRSTAPFKNAMIVVMNVAKMSHTMSGRILSSISNEAQVYYLNTNQSNMDVTLRLLDTAVDKN